MDADNKTKACPAVEKYIKSFKTLFHSPIFMDVDEVKMSV